jgi:hypothetical protein
MPQQSEHLKINQILFLKNYLSIVLIWETIHLKKINNNHQSNKIKKLTRNLLNHDYYRKRTIQKHLQKIY